VPQRLRGAERVQVAVWGHGGMGGGGGAARLGVRVAPGPGGRSRRWAWDRVEDEGCRLVWTNAPTVLSTGTELSWSVSFQLYWTCLVCIMYGC
jgi:hypothetical protein